MRHVSWLSTQTCTWGGSNRFSLVLMTKRNRPSMTTVGILGFWNSGYQVVTLRTSVLQGVSGLSPGAAAPAGLPVLLGTGEAAGLAGDGPAGATPALAEFLGSFSAFCSRSRWYSLRSGVWRLARSYSARFRFLSSAREGSGSVRRFGAALVVFLALGFLLEDFPAVFFWFFEEFPAFAGLGMGKLNSKVWPTARGGGGTSTGIAAFNLIRGLSPRVRGNQHRHSGIQPDTGLSPRVRGTSRTNGYGLPVRGLSPRVRGTADRPL